MSREPWALTSIPESWAGIFELRLKTFIFILALKSQNTEKKYLNLKILLLIAILTTPLDAWSQISCLMPNGRVVEFRLQRDCPAGAIVGWLNHNGKISPVTTNKPVYEPTSLADGAGAYIMTGYSIEYAARVCSEKDFSKFSKNKIEEIRQEILNTLEKRDIEVYFRMGLEKMAEKEAINLFERLGPEISKRVGIDNKCPIWRYLIKDEYEKTLKEWKWAKDRYYKAKSSTNQPLSAGDNSNSNRNQTSDKKNQQTEDFKFLCLSGDMNPLEIWFDKVFNNGRIKLDNDRACAAAIQEFRLKARLLEACKNAFKSLSAAPHTISFADFPSPSVNSTSGGHSISFFSIGDAVGTFKNYSGVCFTDSQGRVTHIK